MGRTQIGSDLILNNSIKFEDLEDSVNAYGAKEPKIYRMSNHHSAFQEIDYTILNLFPVRTFRRGELNKCEWFADNLLTDKVLIVEIAYDRDYLGYALNRTTIRTWINNDNSLNSLTKVTFKDYTINQGESTKEGKLRRGALVTNIERPILSAMHEVLIPLGWSSVDILFSGSRFMDEYDSLFSKFIKNSSRVTKRNDPNYGRKKIIVAIEEEQDIEFIMWLDVPLVSLNSQTIREFLISEFSL